VNAKDLAVSYPHCDARVLHQPGECSICDLYPEDQQDRITDGIKYTGKDDRPIGDLKFPCPAEEARGDNCQRWTGNLPKRYRSR
jgi:hypothetical protein